MERVPLHKPLACYLRPDSMAYCEEHADTYLHPPRYRKYKSFLAHYGDAADAFNNQQRAQLRALLAQINPSLAPRLRRFNTRDAAVQVNPRRDAAVQCGIGTRTLARLRDAGVSYPRTLAVYSPVAFRSVTCFLEEEGGEPEERTREPRKKTRTRTKDPEGGEEEHEEQQEAKGKARVKFQFLEQKYGYYHCRECNLRWESAYVWCVQGTSKVYFKQFCRKCQKSFNPYRVEDITCHVSALSSNELKGNFTVISQFVRSKPRFPRSLDTKPNV
ncbi:hypothetical protein CgunFtcFv8_027543 [Champsocephalus gunnari]|uniref:3CxxC-type domain-containing protein n=1 Tax=Champsocephalus gunnari TaxID=52237 RepID=A0AAN8DY88_CHAGU|nr:hypothetical protein CgunFtcFv8_027543 [Champsocephalus gunnari]